MFGVKLALMRITRAAILAERFAPQTHAVESLIYHYAITRREVFDFTAYFFDTAADFMAKDLRIDFKGNGLTVLIDVIIRMARKDVRIGTAQANRRDFDNDLMR